MPPCGDADRNQRPEFALFAIRIGTVDNPYRLPVHLTQIRIGEKVPLRKLLLCKGDGEIAKVWAVGCECAVEVRADEYGESWVA